MYYLLPNIKYYFGREPWSVSRWRKFINEDILSLNLSALGNLDEINFRELKNEHFR